MISVRRGQRELEETRAGLEAELAAARQELAKPKTTPTVLVDSGQPAALTRLQENELWDGGIRDISRIDRLVPGMIYGQTGNEARFALRGAYTNQTGPEGEPVLAIYEDGMQATTTTDALGPYVDIESIEVLRGPQGVSHGRNALAGAVVSKPMPKNTTSRSGLSRAIWTASRGE